MSHASEYLVGHGSAGAVGRFRAVAPLACRRGDRVVIRTPTGLDVGVVRCPATAQHARLLDDPEPGELLRLVTPEDDAIAAGARQRGQQLFDDAQRLAAELQLPLQILDVEVQFDGHRVTLYSARWAACDERPLVSQLSKRYEVLVALRDLGLPEGASACGKPDCGNSGGGCTTCATGGGCASGCGSKGLANDVREYFSGLRQQMEKSQRVPLA